jgi:HK97 gp10 family phage protein
MNIDVDVREFERKLEKAGKDIEKTMNESIKSAAFETEGILKSNPSQGGTPIDTGRARSSWKTAKAGDDWTVSNNVDYIEYLNEGSSQQAPENFVEKAVQKVVKNFKDFLRDI